MGVATLAHAQTRIYVDASAPPGGDGTSWATAYRDLQVALDEAIQPNTFRGEVLIAAGLYVPTEAGGFRCDLRGALASGATITIQGGYAGVRSADPDEFDPDRFPTVLSADRNGDDTPGFGNREDNCWAALELIGKSYGASNAQLRGITFRGATFAGLYGLGVNSSGGLVLDHCVFEDNRLVGASLYRSRGLFRHCRVSDNGSLGVQCSEQFPTEISDSIIESNGGGRLTRDGGGVLAHGSVFLMRTVIADNRAVGRGGGVCAGYAYVQNSLLVGNVAGTAGGGLAGPALIIASTITGNSAAYGGGVHASGNIVQIFGSILAMNRASVAGDQLSADFTEVRVAESLLEGGVDRAFIPWANVLMLHEVLDATPRFIVPPTPASAGMPWRMLDLRLRADSPGVDSIEGFWIDELTRGPDLRGSERRVPAVQGRPEYADMGCYELPTRVCAADLDDGSGLGRRDEAVTVDDLVMYMAAFNAGGLLADLDAGTGRGFPDRSVTVDDLVYFLAAFASGC
jgi:hypothetical protein